MKNLLYLAVFALFALSIWWLFRSEGFAPRLFWHEGAKQSYSLHLESSTNYSLPGIPEVSVHQKLDGLLHLHVLEVSPSTIKTAFELTQVAASYNGKSDAKLSKLYQTPFLVSYDQFGRIMEVILPNSLSETESGVLEGLVSSLEVVFPEEPKKHWDIKQSGITGEYIARYNFDAQTGHLRKRLLDFTHLNSKSFSEGANAAIRKSKWEFTLPDKKTSWLDSCEAEERFIISGKEKVSFEMSLSLRPFSTASSQQPPVWDITSYDTLKKDYLQGIKNPTSRAEEIEIEAVREGALKNKVSAEDLIKKYHPSSSIGETIKLKSELSKFLQAFPEQVSTLETSLRDASLDKETARYLIYVLQMTDVPQAQNVLIRVGSDQSLPEDLRTAALSASAFLEHPSEATRQSLWGLSEKAQDEKISTGALFAYGAAAGQLKQSDPGGAAEIHQNLSLRLQQSMERKDSGAAVLAMQALSNTRYLGIIQDGERAFAQGDSALRTAAADALGGVEDDFAGKVLYQQLQREPNPEVRTAIYQAFSRRTYNPDLMGEIEQNVANEANPDTRRSMIEYLIAFRSKSATAQETLNRLRQQEKDASIYRLIIKGLH